LERDPTTSVGVPKWSPAGDAVVFLRTRQGRSELWTVAPDGGGQRQLADRAWAPCWSADGRWLDYQAEADNKNVLAKVSLETAQSIVLQRNGTSPAISPDGSALYYFVPLRSEIFGWRGADLELRRAQPEDGRAEAIARIPAERIPFSPLM